MDFAATLKIALRALARNKMRSVLTMLGIIIGVGAVIAMVGVGQGAQQKVQDQIASMGTNLLFVSSGTVTRGGLHMGWGQTKTLVYEDMKAIQREIPTVAKAAPGASFSAQVVFENQNWYTRLTGTEPPYFDIRDWPMAAGSSFSQDDVTQAANVAVIGATVRQNLFGAADPIGATIRIGNLPFQVVGVLSAKGQSGMGQDQDDTILVPYTTVMKKLRGITFIQQVTVSAVSAADTTPTADRISALLRTRHKIQPGDPDDFMVRTMEEMASVRVQATQTMTALLASIAGVSLLVGGIGIMNIMLVSVTERTREIGLRMAIGARGRDVLFQFLIEAVVLSLFGGTIGIGLGFALSEGVTFWMQWPTAVSANAVVVAFGFAAMTGIFFGFYPARKAAALDPIDALRFE